MTNKHTDKMAASAPAVGLPGSGGLQRQLLRSHFTIALIGIALLIVALVSTMVLRVHAVRLAQLRGPTTRASLQALSGTHRSLAGLRGWILLGEPRFRDDFESAWQDDIRPAVETMRRLRKNWTNPQNNQRLQELETTLAELEQWQRQAAGVAQLPENEPAQLLRERKLEPIIEAILADITTLIEAEKETETGNQRKRLLSTLHDFRSAFTLCQVRLAAVIDTGSDQDEQLCYDMFIHQREVLDTVLELEDFSDDEQRQKLLRIENNTRQYDVFRDEALAIRQSDEWNVARHLLTTQCVPRAGQATELLRAVSTNQAALMQSDARRVTTISNIAIVFSLGLVVAMAVTARMVSTRSSSRLTRPIAALARATRELAEGRLTEDLPVADDGELGQLTRAFNDMRFNLQESELRFARTIDDAPFPIMIHAEDGLVHKTNQVWTEVTGYDSSQIPNMAAWTELAYGQRRDAVKSQIDRLYAHNHRVHEGEYELTTSSGEKRVWDFSSAPLGMTPDGKRLVVSMAMDITDRKRAELGLQHAHDALELRVAQRTEQLVAANEKWREVVEQASDGIFISDEQGRFLEVNTRGCEMTGFSHDEILTMSIKDFVPEEDQRRLPLRTDEIVSGKTVLQERRMKRKDGSLIPIEVNAKALSDGRLQSMVRDITDRKQAEQELRLSAEVMENMAEGVCLLASDGCLVLTNPRFDEIFGYEPGELIGRHTAILNAAGEKYPEETANEIMKELEENGVWSGDVHNIRKDKKTFWTHSSVSTYEHPQYGNVRVAVVEDITERKQAEEEARRHRDELAHVARVSTMGEMATGIAHELNQPLAAISLYSDAARMMVGRSDSDSHEVQTVLSKLEDQVIRAGDIVRRLREYVKKTGSVRVSADLNTLVQDVARFVEPDIRKAEVMLVVKTQKPSPSVVIDQIQIQQVLVNLIRNAIDAMLETPTGQREVIVSTRILQDGRSEVVVCDAGKGLDQDESEQAFNAFFSTKQEGLGMGLPISRSIVEAHGGKLWAKANTGPGVTFGFTIPLENGHGR